MTVCVGGGGEERRREAVFFEIERLFLCGSGSVATLNSREH